MVGLTGFLLKQKRTVWAATALFFLSIIFVKSFGMFSYVLMYFPGPAHKSKLHESWCLAHSLGHGLFSTITEWGSHCWALLFPVFLFYSQRGALASEGELLTG